MIEIDGSFGEGGGQVLRSALTLSAMTGKTTRISQIRARRPKPGLMAQHLQAVKAAARVGNAHVEGAQLRSSSLVFEPNRVSPGVFHFDIGTAGSTSLVLQTIYLPLSFAGSTSVVTITGGTHVPWSPCFHFLEQHWLRYLKKTGLSVDLELELAGFYPKGGGRLRASIESVEQLNPLQLVERGSLNSIRGISAVANLPDSVAERQRKQALNRLKARRRDTDIQTVRMPSRTKGTFLLLITEFEYSQCCYYSLGELGKPAERVADEAINELEEFLATNATIDQFLADQLILPLSFAGGVSEFSTSKITQHLVTNVEVVRKFLPVSIEVHGELGREGIVRIEGVGVPSVLGWKE